MGALFSLIEKIDLTPGKANLVLGPAGEISDILCEHLPVRVISFTGSTPVGKKLIATYGLAAYVFTADGKRAKRTHFATVLWPCRQ